tara:strand:+ start:419 stop:838 length:420 start_codon:yes stop_codon:yes gene_type:complete
MEIPDQVGTGAAGGVVLLAATVAAIWRHQVRVFIGAVFDALLKRQNNEGGGSLLDYKSQLTKERTDTRQDLDRLTSLVDDIAERVRALEQTATAWKVADVVNTNEVQRLQADVQRIAGRIGTDMDGLRDLLLEVLKRTR